MLMFLQPKREFQVWISDPSRSIVLPEKNGLVYAKSRRSGVTGHGKQPGLPNLYQKWKYAVTHAFEKRKSPPLIIPSLGLYVDSWIQYSTPRLSKDSICYPNARSRKMISKRMMVQMSLSNESGENIPIARSVEPTSWACTLTW
jgi:hypothetical protein